MGNNIKLLREAHDMTQADLAQYLGVKVPAVSKWERGLANPRMDKLILMAQRFGCTTDAILGLTPIEAAGAEDATTA